MISIKERFFKHFSKLKTEARQPASKIWVFFFYTYLCLLLAGGVYWNLHNEQLLDERINRIEFGPQVTKGEYDLHTYKIKEVAHAHYELSKRVWIAEQKLATAERRIAELEKRQGKLPTQMFFIPQPPMSEQAKPQPKQ
ncbi:MAG: hypothetical protein M0Z99_13335 [Betaproteobacteria bacterium]|nr:hypothetical protein [Betaproteobacteria bacterium]